MASRRVPAKSGVIPAEFHIGRTTYFLNALIALWPDKTVAARGEIDADHPGLLAVGSSSFFSRIRRATDVELSRVFHE